MEIGFSLCDEIEEEILLRLPTKSISRFSCVSKCWYNKFTSFEFAQKHLKRQRQTHANNLNLMLHGSGGPLQSVRFSGIYSDKDDAKTIPTKHNQPLLVDCENYIFHVVGSCDGVLLILATSSTGFSRCLGYVIYIWNPTTGVYKTLPRQLSSMPDSIVLGFGPDLATTEYNNNNHYKVLLLETVYGRTIRDPPIHNFNMYTTRTNSWKPLLQNIGPYGYFFPHPQGMILAYNSLHYVAEVRTTDDDGDLYFNNSIMSFDLKDDKFRVLPIVDPTRTLLQVCALNGDLCALSQSFTDDDSNFYSYYLWRMKNFGVKNEECWTKICSIDCRLAMDKPFTILSLLHVLEDGQILFYAQPRYLHQEKPFIVSYHIENEKASFLVQCNVPYWSIPVVYEESLISPNAVSTAEEEPIWRILNIPGKNNE
ncbi:hypothetical protein FRX31_005448 [Thalictrum thalictroides]|uniref:F-box domain-containing protein n=1 Tax=Thalictrum thalictroides TaxID=46969 RepID=A0A7J6X7Y1_THATH|nr:hypothetical protein FRX31_005448 [Thalictrum thalictroides]